MLVGSRVPRDRMPVLTDLGLLKDTGTVPAGSTTGNLSVVDGRAVAVGTPRYAAPEQLNGGEITPLVDVYALGMLANECFGGRPSGAWARIVRRATAAIPAQRYSSVANFVRAIRHRHLVRYLLVVCALLAVLVLVALAFRIIFGVIPASITVDGISIARRISSHGRIFSASRPCL